MSMRLQLKTAEWQTRTICQFVAAAAPVTGDSNPLLDAAAAISVTLPGERGDDELDEMRGEPTGYVTHEEGMRRMRQAAGSAPVDNLSVDSDGNVTGDTLTAEQPDLGKAADANAPGSFEMFMNLLGNGGTPAPRGPVPT
jgi:hypothetical protein